MTLRRTASLARVLWYGSLAAGALIGGTVATLTALHYTAPQRRAT